MEKDQKILATSELLENIVAGHSRNKISIGEIKNAFHERGFALLFIIFSLPLFLPVPVPIGIGVLVSIPLTFFCYQIIINADSPYLPQWMLRREISFSTFKKIVAKTLPGLKFIEKFLKKRLLIISDNRVSEVFIGIFILTLQIPIILPMPLSNSMPGVSIVLISLGMLEKDGLMIIAGKLFGLLAWAVFITLSYAVLYGANKIYQEVPEEYRGSAQHILEPVMKQLPGYMDTKNK